MSFEAGPGGSASFDAASAVFADYQGRRETGEDVDFELVCARHPDLEQELRSLHRNWSQLEAVFKRLGFSGTLSERIAERFGAARDPAISLQPASRSEREHPDFTVEVLGRLQDRIAHLGRYRVDGELARGGQGSILRVWDSDLRRTLAMKIALPRGGPNAALEVRSLGRFLEEAQVTSQLDHPGIVPVHELGLDAQGRVYFTMKLVKGRNLKTIFDEVHRGSAEWTTTRAVNVILRVCEAVAYAHSKGVVHRDLKPANVMVGRFGEVYVMDWGLAKILGQEEKKDVRIRAESSGELKSPRYEARDADSDSPLITEDGDVLGTPAYMPPEQAMGRLDDIGQRADVYSVGAMLYHLLTGRAPYSESSESDGHYAILYRVQNGPPASLRSVAPKARAALVAICEKAMARSLHERYASMEELADELRAYLEGRVVHAYEGGLAAELRRWTGRNRALASAIVVALLIAIAGVTSTGIVQAREARKARWQEYLNFLSRAELGLVTRGAADSRHNLENCPEEHRGWEWNHLTLRCDLASRFLAGHGGAVLDVATSPDGSQVASASKDRTVRLWELGNGVCLRVLQHDAQVNCVDFDASGSRLITAAQDEKVRVWDAASGDLLWSSAAHAAPVVSLAVDGDGRFATGGNDGDVLIWTDGIARRLVDLESYLDAVYVLAFAPGAGRLVSGSRYTISVLDPETGNASFFRHQGIAMDVSSTGWIAAAKERTHEIELLDLEGRVRATLTGHTGDVWSVAFDREGLRLASASLDETIRIWDVENGELSAALPGHQGAVTCVDFDPSGAWLVSGGEDGTVRVWDSWARIPYTDFEFFRFPVRSIVFTEDGSRVKFLAAGGELLVLDAMTGETVSKDPSFLELSATLEETYSPTPIVLNPPVSFSPDGVRIAKADPDGTVRILRADDGEEAASLPDMGELNALCPSPDGLSIALASRDGKVRVLDLQSRTTLLERDLETSAPRSVAFDAPGRVLAFGNDDGTVHVIDLADGRVSSVWSGHRGPVLSLAFDRASRRAASGSMDRTIRIWDVDRGQSLLVLQADAPISAVAFSPDGKRLISGTEAGNAQVWETEVSTARGLWRARRVRVPRFEDLDPRGSPAQRESARALVDQLLLQHDLVEDVVKAIEEQPNLSPEQRTQALQLARSRDDLTPFELETIAWEAVQDPYRSRDTVLRGLRAADASRARPPARASALVLAGAARYRLGEPEEARAALEAALALEMPEDRPEAEPIGLAFLALALAELGRADEARRTLERAREAGRDAPVEVRMLLREAAERCR